MDVCKRNRIVAPLAATSRTLALLLLSSGACSAPDYYPEGSFIVEMELATGPCGSRSMAFAVWEFPTIAPDGCVQRASRAEGVARIEIYCAAYTSVTVINMWDDDNGTGRMSVQGENGFCEFGLLLERQGKEHTK